MMSDREAVQLWRRVRNGSWPLSVFNKSRFVVVNSILILYALSLFCNADYLATDAPQCSGSLDNAALRTSGNSDFQTPDEVISYICNRALHWLQSHAQVLPLMFRAVLVQCESSDYAMRHLYARIVLSVLQFGNFVLRVHLACTLYIPQSLPLILGVVDDVVLAGVYLHLYYMLSVLIMYDWAPYYQTAPTRFEFVISDNKPQPANTEQFTCSICLNEESDRIVAVACPASHRFHLKCIQNWCRTDKQTCPNCRDVIADSRT